MKDRTIFFLCLILSATAGIALLSARQIPALAQLAPLLLGVAVFLTLGAKRPSLSLLLISGAVTLTLSLRFSTLTWGDPWQDYESVIEVLAQGSTSLPGYRLQQPILPVLVAALSLATTLPPLLLQKIAIPLTSALSAPIIYAFSRRYTGDKAALAASVLFLAGIPYLHWATQGVRETIAIPFFLFALFFSIQILEDGRFNDIIILIPVLIGLILAHHQSAVFFVAILTAVLLVRLYFFIDNKDMKKIVWGGFVIIGGSMGIILLWWAFRIPFIFTSFTITLNQLFLYRFSDPFLPLCVIAMIFALLMLLPLLLPGIPRYLRGLVHENGGLVKQAVYGLQVIIIVIMGIFGLLIVSGNFPFKISYPPVMILAVLSIFTIAICGMNKFLTRKRFYFIIWTLLPGLMLLVGLLLTKVPNSPYGIQIDPLRFIGYLWPAVAIIAGSTITGLKNQLTNRLAISLLFMLLLVTTFPAIVFTGEATDDRSLVIAHPGGELMAIAWYKNQNISDSLSSDRYAIAPARWLNPLGYTVIIPQGRPGVWNGTTYWMLTDRMRKYANFDEWILKTPHPVNEGEFEEINSEMDREYDNGFSVMYKQTERSLT